MTEVPEFSTLELLGPDEKAGLRDTIARFMVYDAQHSEDDRQEVSPSAGVLVRGDILGMLPDFPRLDTYTEVRQEFVDAARISGPRHSA